MDKDFEELLKKDLEERQAEREKKEADEKKKLELEKATNKVVLIIVAICLIIAAIIVIFVCCQPKDYEYKITQFEVMDWDDTKGIVSIEIKNNTNAKKYTYILVGVYDSDGLLVAYGKAAFTPPPKTTDIYQVTIQSPIEATLRGTRAKIDSFNVFDFN